jgi:hypothetical protein
VEAQQLPRARRSVEELDGDAIRDRAHGLTPDRTTLELSRGTSPDPALGRPPAVNAGRPPLPSAPPASRNITSAGGGRTDAVRSSRQPPDLRSAAAEPPDNTHRGGPLPRPWRGAERPFSGRGPLSLTRGRQAASRGGPDRYCRPWVIQRARRPRSRQSTWSCKRPGAPMMPDDIAHPAIQRSIRSQIPPRPSCSVDFPCVGRDGEATGV